MGWNGINTKLKKKAVLPPKTKPASYASVRSWPAGLQFITYNLLLKAYHFLPGRNNDIIIV